jgi:NAD(P)-dependent dehydrogenase (short-subunit alcohol dehydrogenase family)
MPRFHGKVALVTGSGAGIGKATAALLASEGASVVVADIDADAGFRTVDEIEHLGGQAAFCQVDIGTSEAAEAMVDFAVDRFGGLDIVHANAGIDGPNASFVEHTDEIIEKLARVNFLGVIYTCRAAIPALAVRGGGSVIITSSRVAIQVPATMSVYAAGKAGLNKLAEALALEYGPQNIRVNAVAPGVTLTEIWFVLFERRPELRPYYERLIPLHRWATTDDIAKAVAFLASEDAGYITGITLTVDGGLNLRQADLAYQEALSAASGR